MKLNRNNGGIVKRNGDRGGRAERRVEGDRRPNRENGGNRGRGGDRRGGRRGGFRDRRGGGERRGDRAPVDREKRALEDNEKLDDELMAFQAKQGIDTSHYKDI